MTVSAPISLRPAAVAPRARMTLGEILGLIADSLRAARAIEAHRRPGGEVLARLGIDQASLPARF